MKLKSLSFLFLILCNQITAQVKETKKLNQITYLTIKEVEAVVDEDSLLKKFIKIQLIDKKVFLEKKKTAVKMLVSDTTKIKKANGIIRLPIIGGTKEFIDKDPFDETKQEYTYLGQIKFLNAYVIGGLYWEELDYKFISKSDGNEIQSFGSFPYISSNRKFIVSLYDNPYSTECDFELFSIQKNKPVNIFRVAFKNWMPAPNSEMFWNVDGCFYLPILYSTEYWKKDGNYNDDFKYIKITVL